MRYGTKKTLMMFLVLLAGVAVLLFGFAGDVIPFGWSIVVCFLVWIGGAYLVHRAYDRI
ncbi:hypothetical protein [Marivita sp. GX14005]|uniref:hypothetical protein n=1 Tax=Marivita sp. GX14005 TaxID=2942276 RepID=UPI002019D852|nr:hypothetical protein [Marivita sp. GX14005]MCL3883642.1 hypothetical protein [Marivita sp. GX14005]